MMISGATESSDVFCYHCGQKNINELQQNPDKLGNIEITTPNWQERLQDIKENFEELWIENKDKNI